MIEFVMFITRRPRMTREAFQDDWKISHAPCFMKHADKLGAKRYMQSHALETLLNEGLRTSTWIPSPAQFLSNASSAELPSCRRGKLRW